MGCDIHGTIEKRVGGKWVMVNRFTDSQTRRNYSRFAKLAGVRGEGPPARGVPNDVSDSTQLFIDYWNGDGHSHSWLPLKDAAVIFRETAYGFGGKPNDFEIKYPCEAFFEVDDSESQDYRVVFWFDN